MIAVGGFAASEVFGKDGSLHVLNGHRLWLIRIMGVAFALAGLAALHAVFPTLKRRRTRVHSQSGLIFFGHLRHRGAASIKKDLNALDDDAVLDQLASQLDETSRIAWNKHARLQRSHVLLALAIVVFALAEIWH